jgi:phosphoglycerate dehydrogenase-like enzyme
MTKKILVTDSLFIFPEHESRIREAGFILERLDKPNASAEELTAALRDKHGYILGGIERVTVDVLDGAPLLEAIAFTGSGYTEFIPSYTEATQRGIAITSARGANARAVAEHTLTLILAMLRRLPALTAPGGPSFVTVPGFGEVKLGVVGFGAIGKVVVKLAQNLGMNVVVTTRHPPQVNPQGVDFLPLESLLEVADVVSLHVDKVHGEHVLDTQHVLAMKPDAILVNTAFPEAANQAAVLQAVRTGRLWAAYDAPFSADLSGIAPGRLIMSNAQSAFNTSEANRLISDRVTQSIINLLIKGADKDVVNPDFVHARTSSR